MKEGYCHSQRHVHDGGHASRCRRPGGRPETFPGRPARFVHVHVRVDDTRHHHAVAHIQHLQAQTRRRRWWLCMHDNDNVWNAWSNSDFCCVSFALFVTSQATSVECGCI